MAINLAIDEFIKRSRQGTGKHTTLNKVRRLGFILLVMVLMYLNTCYVFMIFDYTTSSDSLHQNFVGF
ncbi:MAG: hypothetical protein XD67_0707 [Thermodesulfobacterium commune]|jgi:hypothetical protein|nr:MAG: hypothetical protein XD55_0511 [Thermodesulfobacterium commune]KUK37990.1 MAG: hypothetical protein XD67_0707 [Thermodesulfobacterium commune]MBZ4680936.1 hypothetical protein [Thermodesulfobacterium sp.]MDK2861754.1 hypothetical protein [Thermodesulfobacterium sp.]MDN5378931.1 hypothetical protein [Thermodesulfobacterium sp.]